jgi:hypothetical protein
LHTISGRSTWSRAASTTSIAGTARPARTEPPILRYFLATGDWLVIQVADVLSTVVPADVTVGWIERGRQWVGCSTRSPRRWC